MPDIRIADNPKEPMNPVLNRQQTASLRLQLVVATFGCLGALALSACAATADAGDGGPPPAPMPIEGIPNTSPDGDVIPADVLFDQDQSRFPEATQDPNQIKIGDSVDPNQPPPGIQPDGSFDAGEVPELIPVSIDGVVVGFVLSADLFGSSAPPAAVVDHTHLQILNRDLEVIGEFDDGIPVLFEGGHK